jgi:hypothetical protein
MMIHFTGCVAIKRVNIASTHLVQNNNRQSLKRLSDQVLLKHNSPAPAGYPLQPQPLLQLIDADASNS